MSSWAKELDRGIEMSTARGYYHIILFYLLCTLAGLPTAFLAFSQVFTSATPVHWCTPPPELTTLNISLQQLKDITIPHVKRGETTLYDQCHMYDINILMLHKQFPDLIKDTSVYHMELGVLRISKIKQFSIEGAADSNVLDRLKNEKWDVIPCKYGWIYEKQYYGRTLVTDSDLVCEMSWLPRLSTTLFWVGSIFGVIIFGWMSDKWGRKPTILLMITIEVPLTIITSFISNYMIYTVLRVLSGIFFPALYQIPFILALESMPANKRTYTGMTIGMVFATSMCLLALISYAIRDWFSLSLATTLPFILLFIYFKLIYESPRWLLSQGRITEAENVLREMGKANGILLDKGFLLKLHEEVKASESILEPTPIVPQIIINRKQLEFLDDVNKESEPDERRISDMQTFKYEPNSNTDSVDSMKTTKIERKIALEVAEIVNKKSRHKNFNKKNISNIDDINLYSMNEMNEDENREVKQVGTQTDSSNHLRRKSTLIVNKLLNKDVHTHFDDQYSESEVEATPLDIVRYPNIRKKFLILTFDWICNAVVYNSLSYNTPNFGVNDYIAFFIGGVVELPSYLIAWRLMDIFGRRWTLSLSMATGGLACISCVFVSEDTPWITVTLAMLGKLCVAASFAVFYVFVGELLPTVLRAQAMGISSFISGLGLLSCPYIVYLSVYSRVVPLVIMGVLSLSGAMAALFLPETLNTSLPQTTRDGEMFGKHFKFFSCPNKINTTRL